MNSGSFDALRCRTKSTMPPSYKNVCDCLCPGRSSTSAIVRPRFRNAITCKRSATVANRNSVSSNTSGSGQNVTAVPVCPRFDCATALSLPWGTPGFTVRPVFSAAYSWRHVLPSRSTSSTRRVDSALTTDTPTPCSPPDTLYPPPPNLPPACNVVSTISAADRPLYCGWSSTGIPRPLSATRHPPSASNVMSTRVQYPAIASSTALSTTSQIRWCKPLGLVDPMYIPGRLRTGSRPSSTWMCSAE